MSWSSDFENVFFVFPVMHVIGIRNCGGFQCYHQLAFNMKNEDTSMQGMLCLQGRRGDAGGGPSRPPTDAGNPPFSFADPDVCDFFYFLKKLMHFSDRLKLEK